MLRACQPDAVEDAFGQNLFQGRMKFSKTAQASRILPIRRLHGTIRSDWLL